MGNVWDAQLRPRWRLLRRGGGGALDCNVCGWRGGALLRGMHAAERHCPRCKSSNRHRLIAWHLAGTLRPGLRVLHVAPEQGLGAMLRGLVGRGYTTCDLSRGDVDHRLDLQTAIVAPAAFDLILVNHVLEHVPDDVAALRNIARMLVPGGKGIVTVPMRQDDGPTDEDLGALTPHERRARFGQDDHWRIYGTDFVARLQRAGLQCRVLMSGDAPADEVALHVMGGETIFEAYT